MTTFNCVLYGAINARNIQTLNFLFKGIIASCNISKIFMKNFDVFFHNNASLHQIQLKIVCKISKSRL